MLSCGKVIGQLSRITRNAHPSCVKQTSKFIGITRLTNLRHASDKKVKKTSKASETTVKPAACVVPKQTKIPESLKKTNNSSNTSPLDSKCDVKNSGKTLPPMCEEICGKVSSESGTPEGPSNSQKYWKQILAALILAGVTVYAMTKTDYVKDKVSNSSVGPSKNTKKDKDKRKEKIRNPPNSLSIPPEVPYLLIGGGTAAFSAFRSIKSKDPKAKVLVISEESDYPYMRPPLSKELWYNRDRVPSSELNFKQWNGTERSLFYEPKEFYTSVENLISSDKGGVAVASGWKVKKLDPYNKTAILDDGYEIKYDKCLLATGGSPKNLPIFESADDNVKSRILTFRTKDDFMELEAKLQDTKVNNIVIIGGGFLGSELACSLARNLSNVKKKVYQVYKEKFIMSQILPEYLSDWTTKRAKLEGVISMGNAEVKDYQMKDGQLQLLLTNGESLAADQIIVAIGVNANTELATHSGLEVENNIGGFIVNAELAARRDLWAAGDVACFYDVRLGRRRVEHHDHAVISGRLAGENMTGAGKPYLHQSMFWSDLGPEVGYEAIGIIDSTLPTVGVFAKSSETSSAVTTDALNTSSSEKSTQSTQKSTQNDTKPNNLDENSSKLQKANEQDEDYGKGVLFYLRDDVVVGIVLWNIFNRMSIARQVLARGTHQEELSEISKLFSIHED